MSARVAILIGAGLIALTGCSEKPAAVDCATRFASLSTTFPSLRSSINASYVFDTGKRGTDQSLFKDAASVEAFAGGGRQNIADFERRDLQGGPWLLLTEGKSLIGIGKPVKDTADAIRQGCALEARYGTLRNVRLTAVNPILRTKNER